MSIKRRVIKGRVKMNKNIDIPSELSLISRSGSSSWFFSPSPSSSFWISFNLRFRMGGQTVFFLECLQNYH